MMRRAGAAIQEDDTEPLIGPVARIRRREMPMSFKTQQQQLFIEVQIPRNIATFVQARTHHQALAKYETTRNLVMALSAESPSELSDKEAVVFALVQEHAEHPRPLWSALLVLALYPMLSRLRGRLHSDHAASDELDQLVMSAFLEVIARYPNQGMRDRIFMRLRQMTHRLVFKRLRYERRVFERVQPVPPSQLRLYERICMSEHRHAPWPETRPQGLSQQDREEQVAFLEQHGGSAIMREKLDPMIATLVHGERLRQYVERVYPHVDGEEHRRLYQRVKRRHSRGMRELRQLLEQGRSVPRTERTASAR